MKPGSVKIIDRVSAVEAIKRLNEEDLLFLNRLIVERLKLISQARATTLMTSFTRGDPVGFQAPDGRILEGRVLRLNKKTISVATDDGHQWNVAPACCAWFNQREMSNGHDPPTRKLPGNGQGGEAAAGALPGGTGPGPRRELRHGQLDPGVIIVGGTWQQLGRLAEKDGQDSEPTAEWFDLLVIDEASQVQVAAAAAYFLLLKSDGHVVLAGDDRQLGPIYGFQMKDSVQGLFDCIFSYMKETHGITPVQLKHNY